VLLSERVERRARRAAGSPDREAHQAPGAFCLPAGHCAHGVDRLAVRRDGLVAVLGPEVAPGAVGDSQAFGHGAQVREVVRAQAAHETVIQRGAGGRVGHGGDGLDATRSRAETVFRVARMALAGLVRGG